MRIRFQADEDLNEVLTLAATSERLLVTHDRKTMPAQFASFIASHRSAGVLVVPQAMPVMQVVEELILVWAATDAEEWVNRICVLPM
ncbi:MAG: hypothetical protein U1E05_26465 [Patescibacteria group bacterium]|nr:hypothetical protein [Patescibacteria group bacterium]